LSLPEHAPRQGYLQEYPMSLAVENDLAPFGWYPDPANSGMLRWWNGRQWTDHLEYPRPEVHPALNYASGRRALGAHRR
jgi:hypothetical protein